MRRCRAVHHCGAGSFGPVWQQFGSMSPSGETFNALLELHVDRTAWAPLDFMAAGRP